MKKRTATNAAAAKCTVVAPPLSLSHQPDFNLARRAIWLGMSPHALDNHLRYVYEVLDVNNLNAALIVAVRLGLVTQKGDEQPSSERRAAA